MNCHKLQADSLHQSDFAEKFSPIQTLGSGHQSKRNEKKTTWNTDKRFNRHNKDDKKDTYVLMKNGKTDYNKEIWKKVFSFSKSVTELIIESEEWSSQ